MKILRIMSTFPLSDRRDDRDRSVGETLRDGAGAAVRECTRSEERRGGADFDSLAASDLLAKAFQCLADGGVEPCSTRIEMGEDRLAHARLPELPDMLRNAGHGHVRTLRGEELADLIGH